MQASIFLAILCTSGVIGLQSPETKGRTSKPKVSVGIDIVDIDLAICQFRFGLHDTRWRTEIDKANAFITLKVNGVFSFEDENIRVVFIVGVKEFL